jgi:hypothetical protein
MPDFNRSVGRVVMGAWIMNGTVLLLAILASVPLPGNAATQGSLDHTHADFCAVVQRRLTGTSLPIRNTVHTDYRAFVDSKAAADPLETHQYTKRDAARWPLRVSCKTKTADHLLAVHGAAVPGDQAAAATSCRQINREIIQSVWRGLGPVQRARATHPPQSILLDGDEMRLTGSGWLEPYTMVYTDAAGRIHVKARALRADWQDWRWKLMPESFRGTHYCHLIAPEHARSLMLGEAAVAPRGAD